MAVAVDRDAKKEVKSATPSSGRWHTASKKNVARELQVWTNEIESISWGRRWNNYAYYRIMTGRPAGPDTYNYACTSRPSSANVYRRVQFASPRYNVLKQCSDALANRVYKDRPIIKVCPIDGDFKARVKSKKLSRWLDAAFYDLEVYPLVEQCAEDSRIWGAGFLKVDVGLDGDIECTRVLLDEVVIDDNEVNTGKVKKLAIRIFVNRQDMLETYGNNPEAIEAINSAPKSTNGLYFGGDLDTTDVIVLREAWSLPFGKKPGRHVLTVGDYTFTDEKYMRDHFPIAKLLFNQMSTDWFGQGMSEMGSGLQSVIDRCLAADDENIRRAAWPRIGIATGSNVNEARLGDTSNGIYYYTGKDVTFTFPPAMSADKRQYTIDTIERLKQTFRLNDQQAASQKPRYTSGKAIDAEDEDNDDAHSDLFLHLEDFFKEIAYLLIEAGEVAKPTVTLPGRRIQEIDWSDVEIARNSYSLRTFSVGSLSGTWAEKMQTVADWYAEGEIGRADKKRLQQVPDLDGYQDLANASLDYIEQVLDQIIEDGIYEPPEPWIDLHAALENCQSRYLLEKMQKNKAGKCIVPQDRLDYLLQFMAQIEEMIIESEPAPVPQPAVPGLPGAIPPPAPGFGIQPALGPAPAPAPLPLAPASAPPVQVAPQ